MSRCIDKKLYFIYTNQMSLLQLKNLISKSFTNKSFRSFSFYVFLFWIIPKFGIRIVVGQKQKWENRFDDEEKCGAPLRHKSSRHSVYSLIIRMPKSVCHSNGFLHQSNSRIRVERNQLSRRILGGFQKIISGWISFVRPELTRHW